MKMKEYWLFFILLFFVSFFSCDDDQEPNSANYKQYLSGVFDSSVYEFDEKIKAIFDTEELYTDIVFTLNNNSRFDTIRMTFFNTNLEKIDIPNEFDLPDNHNTDPYAGIVLKDNVDSFEYTLISGHNAETRIIIESIWYKQLKGRFSGWFYNNVYIDFDIHNPPPYVDSFLVEEGSFDINLEKK